MEYFEGNDEETELDAEEPVQILRENIVGLFVRLRVERAYCIAQILEIYEDIDASYDLGGCELFLLSNLFYCNLRFLCLIMVPNLWVARLFNSIWFRLRTNLTLSHFFGIIRYVTDTTGLFLLVAFDRDKTLARLSYISDGVDVSISEYNIWREKLENRQLLMTKPSEESPKGSLVILEEYLASNNTSEESSSQPPSSS